MIKKLLIVIVLAILFLHKGSAQWTSIGPTSLVGLTNLHLDTQSNILFVGDYEGFWYYDVDTDQWTDVTEPGWIGRQVWSITAHPDMPGRIITGRENAWFKGYMEYTDDWGVTNHFVYESSGGDITDVNYCPSLPNQMFACGWNDIAPGELLKSINGGQSWTLCSNYWHENMTEIAMHPTDENIVYVSGDAIITKTVDGGTTWVDSSNGIPAGLGVYCVSIDPFNTDILLCSNDNGIYKSTDAGANWTQINSTIIKRFAFNSVYENYIAAITFSPYTVLFSSDKGENWSDITDSYPGTTMKDLTFSKEADELYVVAYDEIFITTVDVSVGVDSKPIEEKIVCYPNPIRVQTTIIFDINDDTEHLNLEFFDLTGRKINSILLEDYIVGNNKVRINREDLSIAPGLYYLSINVDGQLAKPIKVVFE